MLLTEKQARETWCPKSVMATGYGMEGNRVVGPETTNPGRVPVGCRCLGSGCAWWRWSDSAIKDKFSPPVEEKFGYCGGAGRP